MTKSSSPVLITSAMMLEARWWIFSLMRAMPFGVNAWLRACRYWTVLWRVHFEEGRRLVEVGVLRLERNGMKVAAH